MNHEAALMRFHEAIDALTKETGLHTIVVFVEYKNGKGRVASTGSPFKPDDTIRILGIAAQAVRDDEPEIVAGVARAELAGETVTVIDGNNKAERPKA